jgi:hypothetical protein
MEEDLNDNKSYDQKIKIQRKIPHLSNNIRGL